MKNKVLVVDDEANIRNGLEELLENAGLDVSTAQDGHECLEQLRKGFRGLILLDIMMPRMDGWDTIRAMIDEELVEGNIISMLTAKDAPGPKMGGLGEYVIDYLTKPFDPKELVGIVRGYMVYLE